MPAVFLERFVNQLKVLYPESAKRFDFNAHLSPLLFCPRPVSLPARLRDEAVAVVRAFAVLRRNADRNSALAAKSPAIPDPGNTSVLMSYDFHVDEAGHLRLIEINTNAAMGLMVDVLHKTHGMVNPFSSDFPTEIMDCFKTEYARAQIPNALKTVAITDEEPTKQRLFAEFVCFKELFERSGFDAAIVDAKELAFFDNRLRLPDSRPVDLVYNRHTDFYFETPATHGLREAMLGRTSCISPHPHEYRLLADKERLVELGRPGALTQLALDESARRAIDRTLIRTFSVAEHGDPDALWTERKKLFFKPMRSFGGKAAYRGASISRRVFDEILKGQYLAQEFVPAGTIQLAQPSIDPAIASEFKYDLRFYVYDDRIQQACARLYQGQMTNSQTPGGGITVINWI